jgi:GH15 family glucan-1,4-alpha-glucosidase
VALDRAIRLATKRSLPLDRTRLLAERDRIYEAVMTHGWDAERGTFVQYFGTDALDAANLIMPLVFFISPNDPRMIGTLNRTIAELVSDSLVHRYEIGTGAGDGLTGREGTFKRDNPRAVVRFLDTGHFALETHAREIAESIREFLR